MFSCVLDRELYRKPIRRLEDESHLAGYLPFCRGLLKKLHAAIERLREPLFLVAQDSVDLVAARAELRIGLVRLRNHCVREFGEKRPLEPDPPAVLRGAPDDPSKDIAASLVRRSDTVA